MVDVKETRKVDFFVLYASQTGNCEAISEDLTNSLNDNWSLDFKVLNVTDSLAKRFLLEDTGKKFDLANKDRLKVCLFICSSTGNGECPENGLPFFRFLRRETAKTGPRTLLSHVFFSVLGLGSSDYSKFQGAPRYLDERLKMLGARTFYYRAEADEATSLEIEVEPWLEGVSKAVLDQLESIKAMSAETIDQLLVTE